MPDLYKYTHFGPYLAEWFLGHKQEHPRASLQTVSDSLGLKSKSHLHKLMHDPRATLSTELAMQISDLIGHDASEREYFQYLVMFCRVRTPEEKSQLYERMHRLLMRLRPRYLNEWQLDLFKEWYIPVVREVVDLQPFPRTAGEVAKRVRPQITLSHANAALECLLRLGLIRKRRGQGWTCTQQVLDAPTDLANAAVHGFQKQMLERSQEAMEHMDLSEREMITTIFSIAESSLEKIRSMVRTFQNDLTREIIAMNEIPEITYQLNLQLFPISIQKKGA